MAPKTSCKPTALNAIIAYFHSSRVAHSVKDLEKALPSVASINGMQVKDYLQNLQDESKIHVEKIGSGNWYWAFADEDKRNKEFALEKATDERDKVQTAVDEARAKLEAANAERADTDGGDRVNAEMQQKQLMKDVEALNKELAKYKENDPIEAERRKKEVEDLKAKADERTDTIYSMEQYLIGSLGMTKDQLDSIKIDLYDMEYDANEDGLRELVEPTV